MTGLARLGRAALLTLAALVLSCPAAAAANSPFTIVGVEPGSAEQEAVVRLRLIGLADQAADVDLDLWGEGAAIGELWVEGAGAVHGAWRIPATAASPDDSTSASVTPYCRRGGFERLSDSGGVLDATVTIEAGSTVDLLVPVYVPSGLAGPLAPARLHLLGLVPVPKFARRTADEWNRGPEEVVELAHTGMRADRVTLLRGSTKRHGATRLAGTVSPARAGVVVELAGRRMVPAEAAMAFWTPQLALTPIGPGMLRYGTATTDAAGRFNVWASVPPGAAVVARTPGLDGITTAGASCAVVVPRTSRRKIRRGPAASPLNLAARR